ncbi:MULTISPECIES: SRPBCC domain-containing protein [Chryseobacterium]|uniref:SRPBCC family protein n=1 Tax=Chryseobacterium TaxID=59732 RepID=UPI00129784A5|nr:MULTISPECIES: SRPBCC domain-containing protein [Chryseobacterium]MDR6920066.1 uncharacterized protein YndB with AHSA1/START domain [Chryseobacterium sp. 2987]
MDTPITVQYTINAPVQKVWKALTDKEEMKNWYFDIQDFEPEVGKEFNFFEPGEEKKYHHHGRILELIPEQRLKHTWSYPDFSKAETTVTWNLQPKGEETLVTLTHENIENFNELGEGFSRENFIQGWNAIIGQSLKLYLENK